MKYLFPVVMILMLAACATKSEADKVADKIVGTWKATELVCACPALDSNLVAGARAEALKEVIHINADGSFVNEVEGTDENSAGKWVYIDSTQEIEVTYTSQGQPVTSSVALSMFTGDTLNVREELGQMGYYVTTYTRTSKK